MAQHTPYCWTDRWIMILSTGAMFLIAASFFHPLWYTAMEAPQYPDKTLRVDVYPGYMTGDMQEIQTLNQYIGVHLPEEVPELEFVPWILGLITLLLLSSLWLHSGRLKSWLLAANTGLLVLAAAGGAICLQYRLYVMGHDRDPNPPLTGFTDFTPPVLGSIEVGNFDATMMIGLGGWMLIGAGLLIVASTVLEWVYAPRIEAYERDVLSREDASPTAEDSTGESADTVSENGRERTPTPTADRED